MGRAERARHSVAAPAPPANLSIELVFDLEANRRVRRVLVQPEQYCSVVFEFVARADGNLTEQCRPDVALRLVAEVIGAAERAEALEPGLEARLAAPVHLPFVVDSRT